MSTRELPWLRLGVLAALGVAVLGVVLVVRGAQQLPDGVQPIDWNRQPCAHCQMLVGDPAHAAQLITQDGDVLAFDDPGCALRYLDEHHPKIHRLWFHHATADRWLPADEVGFLTGGVTPMGSGLLAVERGTPHAIDLAQAHRIALAPIPQARRADASPEEPRR
jgi:copper chaperone NosL